MSPEFDLAANLRDAATKLFFTILDRNRNEWQKLLTELSEEVDALHAAIEKQRTLVVALPKKSTKADRDAGRDIAAHRESARLDLWIQTEKEYRKYLPTLTGSAGAAPREL